MLSSLVGSWRQRRVPSDSQEWGMFTGNMASSRPLEQEEGKLRGEGSGGEDCREPRGDVREDSEPTGSSCGVRKGEV